MDSGGGLERGGYWGYVARPFRRHLSHPPLFLVAEQTKSGGATAAIVGIVALLAIALIVYFAFMRSGDGGGTDIDVTIDPGDAVEAVTE